MGSKKKPAEGEQASLQRLSIEGEFTIYRAAELKPVLLQAAEAAPTLELDLGGVSEFDSAGVQLLLLARRTAREHGHEMQLVRPSDAVLDVLQLLDLADGFGLPLNQRAAA
ncbi:MAG: STAS domain-containing protein [Rhizobacter sp.]|nr:STAS domain-containing protein [Rhizobacter sp.]